MADTDSFVVDAPLPRLRAVSAHEGYRITVTWESDEPGERIQTIDLAPTIFRFKLYAPLRDSADLFRTVQVIDDGFAIGWDGEDLDMASTTISELAEQAMTPADFADFVKRNGYTLDSVAAELGISRRLAAYYTREREIPRAIALACLYLDRAKQVAPAGQPVVYVSGGLTTVPVAGDMAVCFADYGNWTPVNGLRCDVVQTRAPNHVFWLKGAVPITGKAMASWKVGGGKQPPQPEPMRTARFDQVPDETRRR